MIKINPHNKPLNIDNPTEVSKRQNEKFEASLRPEPSDNAYSRENLVDTIKNSKSIEDAVKAISNDVVESFFKSNKLFANEDFVARVKDELVKYFKDDPFAQEILHSLK